MSRILNSFKVSLGKRLFDYRLGGDLDLDEVKYFFKQNYHIRKIWKNARHILGVFSKDTKTYFLKLSTSEGISIVTENEYKWNDYFNGYSLVTDFIVPKNYDRGLYKKKYFYLITDYFNDDLLCKIGANADCLIDYIDRIIELSEVIQKLPGKKDDYRKKYIEKAKGWFEDIPDDVIKKYNVNDLFQIAIKGVCNLDSKPRHGDFAPWHIIKLQEGKLGLIDGEHWLPDGIENYDICFFIQRVFSVLRSPNIASIIYYKLLSRGYELEKLKTVLAARAIGGFLDESLSGKPNYRFAESFKNWVLLKRIF